MSDSYSVLALDKVYGGKLYEPRIPLNTFSSASITDSAAYFGALDGVLYKLDLSKGTVSSVFQTASSKLNRSSFFDEKDKLRTGLDEKYAHDIHKLFTGYLQMGSIFSTVWIDGQSLYFGSVDGAVYALE